MKSPSLESQIYTSRFDDGALDLCVGLGLLGIGLVWLTHQHAYTGLVPALLLPAWMGIRKRITEPRLGRVEFSLGRRHSERGHLISVALLGVSTLALGVAVYLWVRRGQQPPQALLALIPALPGALVGVGFVLVSAMIGARRFAAYGLALAGVATLATWLGWAPGAYLALGGGLLTLWACWLLARFVSTHPDLGQG